MTTAAEAEAERLYLHLPHDGEDIRLAVDSSREAFVAGAEWQAARDQERIVGLERSLGEAFDLLKRQFDKPIIGPFGEFVFPAASPSEGGERA